MIELKQDRLVVSFPEVHPNARLTIEFQRTLRIPDDDRTYPLPPGLGCFPLRHVDDFATDVPRDWIDHGGVFLPMYQSEALWLNFNGSFVPDRAVAYPMAVKIAAGKINAVTGDSWTDGLHRPPQDYVVIPGQPWLDGYCVTKGVIRQFVAQPLGAGYTAEEQITGRAEHGGIQIVAYPMRRDVFERRFPRRPPALARVGVASVEAVEVRYRKVAMEEMGLAPGGRMRQEIYDDPFDQADWAHDTQSRCFVHLANSMVWRSITGDDPPTTPPTAREYTKAGLPWFDYYSDAKALQGGKRLKGLQSVAQLAKQKGGVPLPENQPVDPGNVVELRRGLRKGQVREGQF